MSTRESTEDPWGEPVNLGPPINTGFGAYTQWISPDGNTLYFHAGLPGGYGGGDIWMSRRSCQIPTVSEWSLVVITLLVLTAGTVVLLRRRVGIC